MDPALLGKLIDTLVPLAQILTPLGIAIIGYFQYRSARDIKMLETNTNSIKDALVNETRAAALARGVLQGKAEAAGTTTAVKDKTQITNIETLSDDTNKRVQKIETKVAEVENT